MPLDREDTLRKTERLLQQGGLEAATAEYLRLVDEHLGKNPPTEGLSESTCDILEAAVDALVRNGAPAEAATVLRKFLSRAQNGVPALEKLIAICAERGIESLMDEAQGQLADAYLETGQAAEARRTAEELVARAPWVPAHIDRFRRALVLLHVPDPDRVIAERFDGQTPFTAVDHSNAAPEVSAPRQAAGSGRRDATPPGSGQEEAFTDFRQEVAKASGADGSAREMVLARTYLEMGMVDDAMRSLAAASDSPSFRFEASALLARLQRERGDTLGALAWLERAAETPAPGIEEGRALLYDLATLVEETGDTARAFAMFLDLQSDAGDYRDVPRRLERLARTEAGG